MYICVCTCHIQHTRGEDQSCRSWYFPLPCGSQELPSGHQTLWQVPLPTKPSLPFLFSGIKYSMRAVVSRSFEGTHKPHSLAGAFVHKQACCQVLDASKVPLSGFNGVPRSAILVFAPAAVLMVGTW